MAKHPLTYAGFTSGWLQRFFNAPFDPICVMLAMRTKLLLDVIDEMGHSYNLLRAIGYGWIDFGEVPGEIPGSPGSYFPPLPPIRPPGPGTPGYTAPPPVPGPGKPGYIPPGPPMPGEPGYVPGPGAPGYVPPGPGEPGYVPPGPGPGEPGYVPPGPGPGEPGYVPPPGPGEPGYVPPMPGEPGYVPPPGGPGGAGEGGGGAGSGGGGGYGPPGSGVLAFGPGIFGPADKGGYGGGGWGGGLNCCIDKDDPEKDVSIGYTTLEMACGETQNLTVIGYPEVCEAEFYEWAPGTLGGSVNPIVGYTTVFTAPAGGGDCITPQVVILYCDENQVAFISIDINPPGCATTIGYTTQQMIVNETQTLTAVGETTGCGPLVYNWAIADGGGTLSSPTGDSVVYTAPAANVNCVNNPTITLSCGGVLKDTLKLAVSADLPAQDAYRTRYECKTGCLSCDGVTRCGYDFGPYSGKYCFACCGYHYGCNNAQRAMFDPYSGGNLPLANCNTFNNTYCGAAYSKTDLRTPAQKAAGCCPAGLL